MIFGLHGKHITLAGLFMLLATVASGQNLKEVLVRGVGEASHVVMLVDGVIEHKVFKLTKPDRVVVDLIGVKNVLRVNTRTVPGGPVKQVRVAQFATTPRPITRIVADLRGKVDYRVESSNGKFVLVLVPKGMKATGKKFSHEERVGVGEKSRASKPVPRIAAAAPVQTRTLKTNKVLSPKDLRKSAPKKFTDRAVESTKPLVVGHVEAPKEWPQPRPAVVTDAPILNAAPPVSDFTVQSNPASIRPTEQPKKPEPVAYTPRARSKSYGGLATRPRGYGGRGAFTEDRAPDPTLTLDETSDRRINLDVQGADIRTVLRTLAEYSGRNIVASREVQGEVSATLKDLPWRSALHAILKSHNFGYVEENGVIRVGNLQRIRSEELEEAAAAQKREELLPIETRVVRMQFADADELRESLKDMLGSRGRIQTDSRTNSLIISDIPKTVAMLSEMAMDLDSRTPQVEIVSKIVDVSADNSENLGIQWNAANLFAGGIAGGAGVSAGTAGAAGAIRVGTVGSWGELNGILDALARTKKANIISNPNITTVDNREAKILVGAKIPLIVADEAGNAITQLTTIGIQMRVTPHVNSDQTITLDLHSEVSDLSSQATVQGGVIINTSEANTRVIVQNNETAIIGGLIRDVSSEVKTGIPLLQDLPIIGWLFRNTNKSNDKRELIIFVTPRLVEVGASLRNQPIR